MIKLKDFFSFKNNRFFWVNIFAMIVVVVALILGALWGLDIYTRHGKAYMVPDVKNKSVNQAQLLLADKHMKGVVIDSSYVKELPAGIVLDQTPVGGMKVKEGRTVYLTINSDQVPTVRIPDVIDNSSMRQAAAKLRAMGFKLTEPELVGGEQDWVYGIKYRGRSLQTGDKVPSEAELTLCIGSTQVRDSLNVDSLDMEIDNMMEHQNGGEQSKPEVDDSWF